VRLPVQRKGPGTDPTVERRVRVMHVLPILGVDGRAGGMEYGIIKVANALDPDEVLTSVCSSFEPDPGIAGLLAPHVARFHCRRRRGHDPMWVARLCTLLRRERPDIVHTHAWGTVVEGLVAAKLAGIRYLIHGEHGTMQTKPYQLRVQRWAWGRADRVLSVSSRLAEKMAREVQFPLHRIQTIRNGVDLERFSPARRADGRAQLGLGTDDLCIGTVGRLLPVKDHANMVDALARVQAAGVSFRAFIAGDGPLRAVVEERAAALGLSGRFKVLGHRHDVEAVLAAFDLFVLPSKSEGLSNTIMEALATGVPVVATDVGGASEMVDEGENGLLVPKEDPERLGAALTMLARDPERRRRMAGVNRARAEREFGLEVMVRGYRDLYLGLARSSAA